MYPLNYFFLCHCFNLGDFYKSLWNLCRMYFFLKTFTILSMGIHTAIYVSGYFCFDNLFCVLGRIRKAPSCIAWKKSPKIDIYTFVCSFILSLIHSKKKKLPYKEISCIQHCTEKLNFILAVCSSAGSQHTEGFKKRWFTMDDRRLMYFKDPLVSGCLPLLASLSPPGRERVCWPDVSPSPRMRTPAARCSSAARRTATPSCRGCRSPRRATTGTTASPSSHRTGSSCLPVRRRRSRGIG